MKRETIRKHSAAITDGTKIWKKNISGCNNMLQTQDIELNGCGLDQRLKTNLTSLLVEHRALVPQGTGPRALVNPHITTRQYICKQINESTRAHFYEHLFYFHY